MTFAYLDDKAEVRCHVHSVADNDDVKAITPIERFNVTINSIWRPTRRRVPPHRALFPLYRWRPRVAITIDVIARTCRMNYRRCNHGDTVTSSHQVRQVNIRSRATHTTVPLGSFNTPLNTDENVQITFTSVPSYLLHFEVTNDSNNFRYLQSF